MSLRSKLSHLSDAGPGSQLHSASSRADTLASLRTMLSEITHRHVRARRETEAPTPAAAGGRGVPEGSAKTPEGGPSVRVVRNVLEPDHRHGRIPVRSCLGVTADIASSLALDPGLRDVDLSRCLFLDTETTGLSLGAGTIPFLVGLAWFEDESLVVEQLFLDELDGEVELLTLLADRMRSASCVVSYNGKSYDLPLLNTRFVMNRVAPPSRVPHLDLLHGARRLYRPRLGSVRLVAVEEQVLGMRRERDIDGHEIPGLYWSFLRHRSTEMVDPIIEHNANDLVALAALLGYMGGRYSEVHHRDEPVDHLALARVAVRAKDWRRALGFARAAAEGGAEPELGAAAFRLTGELHGRLAAYPLARDCYRAAIARAPHTLAALEAHLALSKLFEHRFKDFLSAQTHAAACAEFEGAEAHTRRMARLERRIAKGEVGRSRCGPCVQVGA